MEHVEYELPQPMSLHKQMKMRNGRIRGAPGCRAFFDSVRDLNLKVPAFVKIAKALKIEVVFMVPVEHLFHDGTRNLKNWDLDNRLKPLLDALTKSLGINDTKFSCVVMRKRQSDRFYGYVKVRISVDSDMETLLEAA